MADTQSQHRGVPALRAVLTVLLLLTLIAATPRTARAAAAWQFGAGTHTLARNCTTSNQEIMSIDNAGYYGEPGVSPVVGQKYYVQGTWGITGEKLSDKGPENGLLPHAPSATPVRTREDNERCGETATLPPSRHPLSDSF